MPNDAAELTKPVPKEAGEVKERGQENPQDNLNVPQLLESGHQNLLNSRLESRNNLPDGFPKADNYFTGIVPIARPGSSSDNYGNEPAEGARPGENRPANTSDSAANHVFNVTTEKRTNMTVGYDPNGRSESEQLNTSIAQETGKLESMKSGVALWNYGEKFGPFERTATVPVSQEERNEIMNKATASMSPEERKNLTSSLANYRYQMDEFHNGGGEDKIWKGFAHNLGVGNEPEMPTDVKRYYDRIEQEMRTRGLNRDLTLL